MTGSAPRTFRGEPAATLLAALASLGSDTFRVCLLPTTLVETEYEWPNRTDSQRYPPYTQA